MGHQAVCVLGILISAISSEAFLSTCFSSTFLDNVNRKLLIFEESGFDVDSVVQYLKPLLIQNRIYENFDNKIFDVGYWRNFSFSTKLPSTDFNSSLSYANIKEHTVKDIIRNEVKALYSVWGNDIGQNEDSELSNAWLNGSNLKNISKETKEKLVGVSRFLVLIMDEVLVTWNDILA